MAEERALSVTEAVNLARRALETVRVRVVGEVSEFNDKPGYKAAYFSVCDAGAVMPCLMWRDEYAASGVVLRAGMKVELTGHFSAYAAKGRMQFVVRRLEPAGEGRLRMIVAERAQRLEAEGLMRPERKRPLPRYPERIAVVTSPRGKAVHDVLRTLRRRYPLAEVLLAGVAVEGDAAPMAICEGLQVAAQARPDVILLVRGGGSYEDLMPFNDEGVARAVAASPTPVVTGIGHEPDNSIADMVADVRASTPTAAAEACAPSLDEVAGLIRQERRLLGRALSHRVDEAAHRVARVAQRPVFCDPYVLVGPGLQRLDHLRARLRQAIPDRVRRDDERFSRAHGRMIAAVARVTERAEQRLSAARTGIVRAAPLVTADSERRLALSVAGLEGLSPLRVLARGYAAAFAADGHTVVRSILQVRTGEHIGVQVSDGTLECTVNEIREATK